MQVHKNLKFPCQLAVLSLLLAHTLIQVSQSSTIMVQDDDL